MTAGDVWTSGEICAHYRVSRSTLREWRSRPHFPEPLVWRPKQGGVWDRRAVEAWKADRDRPVAARRGQALALYRQHGNMSAVARELEVTAATVRRWLVELGEIEGRAAA